MEYKKRIKYLHIISYLKESNLQAAAQSIEELMSQNIALESQNKELTSQVTEKSKEIKKLTEEIKDFYGLPYDD